MPTLRFALGFVRFEVKPTFLLIALPGLGLWFDGRTLALWLAACVLAIGIHELGHALAFRALGGAAITIELSGLGGETRAEGRFTAPRHIAIALAGPVAGAALSVAARSPSRASRWVGSC